jgi:hypothetical protein
VLYHTTHNQAVDNEVTTGCFNTNFPDVFKAGLSDSNTFQAALNAIHPIAESTNHSVVYRFFHSTTEFNQVYPRLNAAQDVAALATFVTQLTILPDFAI